MKGLLIYLAIAIPVLFGPYIVDTKVLDEEPAPVVEMTEEEKSWADREELEALKDVLYDMEETEIESYLQANNIQYTAKDVNDGRDRYIRVVKGDWELEVLYDINYCIDPLITIESTVIE